MDKVQTIIDLTCEHFGIPKKLVKMKSGKKGARTTEVIEARQVSMFMLKEHTALNLKKIGAEFSNRDHSTVIHALTRVQDMIDTEKKYGKSINELRAKIDLKFNPTKRFEKQYEELGYIFTSAF